jgi:uncharacterized protein (DUF427 family)
MAGETAMTKAVWNGVTLAESDDIALVEGNAYFPAEALNAEYFRAGSATRDTYCHWKGTATYRDVVVDGAENAGAAWTYDAPYDEAAVIKDRFAFWNGVEIVDAPEGMGLLERTPSLQGGKTGWEALCWMLVKSPKTVLTPADVTAATSIPESGLAQAWQVYDVQRYASRYRWSLEGGGGTSDPVRLQKAA